VNQLQQYWLALAVFFVIDLLVSSVKSAMTHAGLPYLFNLREKNQESVDRTIKVIERPRLRTSLRLALILTHFMLAGALILLLRIYLPSLELGVLLLLLLAGMLILGVFEFLLEGLILKDPARAAVALSGVGLFLDVLLSPVSRLMTLLLGENAAKLTMATMTDEDLRSWVESEPIEGNLEKGEREMIYSIFQFGDTMAREIMVPRIDVLALDIRTRIGDARKTFVDAGHSRVPIYEDTIDNVVGLLYAKDLLLSLDNDGTLMENRQILRTAYFVPETKKVDELLAEMQSRGVHMTLVVDEFGGVAGVVTLEDIVEEIVGEIRDEYDEVEEQLFQKLSDQEYIFLGRVDLDDFNEITGMQLATDNADTLGGFIYGEIGHIPIAGETVLAQGMEFTVEEVLGRRIQKVRARFYEDDLSISPQPADKESKNAE